VNKPALVQKIIGHLAAELELYAKAARAAREEATDPQNKAENKYDTRGLEASYLARGQARQVAETEQAMHELAALNVRAFGPQDPIHLGALVGLERKGERMFYFIAPRAGGTEVKHEKKEVLVLTPQSPLGQQLVGKRQGERFRFELGGTKDEFLIAVVA
jgi:transcription elongation GreA/GreB family factor